MFGNSTERDPTAMIALAKANGVHFLYEGTVMAGTRQHAARLRAQGEHVAGHHQVIGPRHGGDGGLHGDGAIGGADAGGDPGGGEDHILGDHVVAGIDPVQVLDPGLFRPRLLVAVAEQQLAVNLSAHAFQRRRRQNALRRAARAHVHVDAGLIGLGAMDHARDVAIGDEADRGAGLPHARDDLGMARALEDADRDV